MTFDPVRRGERLRNAFNGETFVFHDGLDAAGFGVILEPGGSGGGDALAHVHPSADERFTVHRGAIDVHMNGLPVRVAAGETVTVPRGTPHFFVNGIDGTTELTIEFAPPGRQVRFFVNFARLTARRTEWFSARGKPHLLLMALVLHRYRGCLYLAGRPIALQRALFACLAAVAVVAGYRLEIGPDEIERAPAPVSSPG